MTDIDERALTLDDADPEELAETSAAGSGESLAKETNTKPAEQTKVIDPEPEIAVTDGRPNIWKWIAIGLLALGIAGAVFGVWRYQNLSATLSTMRTADSERTAAIDAASAYAMKSLTYSYEDPDGFFKNVKTDAAEPLKNKYSDAEKLLKAIMLQAQVTSRARSSPRMLSPSRTVSIRWWSPPDRPRVMCRIRSRGRPPWSCRSP